MKQEFRKNSFIAIVILAVVFGMASGVVGELIARVYFLDNTFNLPFYGEINFSNGNYRGPDIIIRDAKKVVVEQNNRVIETINSVQSSLVGIYKKNLLKKPAAQAKEFNLGNYYKLGQNLAQGFIITSDGWIMTDFKPENMNYVVITQDKKIYSIDGIKSDPLTEFYFLHVWAKDLPVRKFAQAGDIKNGQLALAVNWTGEAKLSSIVNNSDAGNNILFFSDSFLSKILLSEDLGKKFKGSFLFNLSGDIIGLSDKNGAVEPIYHFTGAIKSLLKNRNIKRPGLGVNYVDLSKLVGAIPKKSGQGEYGKGALIYKNAKGISVVRGSAGESAGLKDGDIIISVEGITIDDKNSLTNIIQQFMAGDKVNIVYLRGGKEREAEATLGEAIK